MSTPVAPAMSSSRPYLVRALIEWINDNELTPYLQVDAGIGGVRVPASAVREGKITLNVAARAVAHLLMDNQGIGFEARFGGVAHAVYVPMAAIEAVYARENGQGMAFPPETAEAEAAPTAAATVQTESSASTTPAPSGTDGPRKPPFLRVIK